MDTDFSQEDTVVSSEWLIQDQMWEYQPGMPGIKRAWIDNPDLD